MGKKAVWFGLAGVVVGVLVIGAVGRLGPKGLAEKLQEVLFDVPRGSQADQSPVRVAGGSTTFWAPAAWLSASPCAQGDLTNNSTWYSSMSSAPSNIYIDDASANGEHTITLGSRESWKIETFPYSFNGKAWPSGSPPPQVGATLCSSSDMKTCGAPAGGTYYVVVAPDATYGSFFCAGLPPAADTASPTAYGQRYVNPKGDGTTHPNSACKTDQGQFCDHLEFVRVTVNGKVQTDPDTGTPFFPCPGGHCIVGIQ